MVQYVIYEHVAYEGEHEVFRGTRKDCRDYLKKKLSGYQDKRPSILDDLEMFRLPRKDMIEELWKEIKPDEQ